MAKRVEIYFDDLSTGCQNRLLALYGVRRPEEMNWDTFPVAVITKEEGGE